MFGFVTGGGMCVQDVPPGRRVNRDDLRRRIIDVVAVFWLLPGAPKGKWFEAEVKRVNSRNGTMKIRYLEGGSEADVNIEEPVVQKRDYVRRPTPKCPCGK